MSIGVFSYGFWCRVTDGALSRRFIIFKQARPHHLKLSLFHGTNRPAVTNYGPSLGFIAHARTLRTAPFSPPLVLLPPSSLVLHLLPSVTNTSLLSLHSFVNSCTTFRLLLAFLNPCYTSGRKCTARLISALIIFFPPLGTDKLSKTPSPNAASSRQDLANESEFLQI